MVGSMEYYAEENTERWVQWNTMQRKIPNGGFNGILCRGKYRTVGSMEYYAEENTERWVQWNNMQRKIRVSSIMITQYII